MSEHTEYMPSVAGSKSNWNLPVRADFTSEHVGITQTNQRVLLTPEQFNAVVRFVRAERAKARAPRPRPKGARP